jgi:hypothetical protein
MRELTTLERFTLVALQRSNRPMTCETLMSMTMEWREPLEAALDTLTKANLVRSSAEGSRAYYSAVPLSKEPIISAVSDWLHRFYDKTPRWLLVPGDPEENNSACCAWVLLAAVLTGSRDPDFLAHILGLPERFVALVLWIAKNSEFWWCEQVFDLEAALYKNADDFADIQDALRSVMEGFDLDYYSMEEWDHLQKLRDGMLFGGLSELILESYTGNEQVL